MRHYQLLVARAIENSKKAYCPYSNFRVGAALVTSNGIIFDGCNCENASYGLTCCAERSAIFAMIAAGEQQIEGIVIFTPTNFATAPCGACRQVINEFGPKARVISVCNVGGEVIDTTLDQLLPGAFGPANLV